MKNVSILKNNIVHIQKSKFSGLIIDPSLGLRRCLDSFLCRKAINCLNNFSRHIMRFMPGMPVLISLIVEWITTSSIDKNVPSLALIKMTCT